MVIAEGMYTTRSTNLVGTFNDTYVRVATERFYYALTHQLSRPNGEGLTNTLDYCEVSSAFCKKGLMTWE